MNRSGTRELAVHLIYAKSFSGDAPSTLLEERLDRQYYASLGEPGSVYEDRPSQKQQRYLKQVTDGVAEEEDQLNMLIRRYSVGWDLDRISRITRAILQLAIYECQHLEDVPAGVAINEAVKLAKKYDSVEAGAFVNGILGAYLRDHPAATAPAQTKEESL